MVKDKKAKISIVIIVLIVIIAAIGAYYTSTRQTKHQQQMQQMQQPAPGVTVDKPVVKDIEHYYDFTGNVESVASVEIRARVKGILQEVNFTDGSFVEKGQLLFVIEPDEYQADVDQAKAAVASAEAQLSSAEDDLERVRRAVKSNAVSIEEVSRRKTQYETAKADLKEAQASLKIAEIQLGYTKIHSPISGKLSNRLVDAGNLVGAGENTLLTTVVTVDPVYVSFEMSENILTEYLKANRISRKQNPGSPVSVAAPTETEYRHEGTLDYIGNVVNRTTGTINLRATVDNEDGLLYPGMFARVRLPAQTVKDAVLVEQSAIGTNLGGKYLLTVDEDNVVSTRQVETGLSYGKLRLVESGIEQGESYITRGLQKARPGAKISRMDPDERKEQKESSRDKTRSGE
jgi:RND family efflux transporter MFP subunit